MPADFRDGSVTSPWDDVLDRLDFRTETEGLHTLLADGSLMLEEQNSGRILMLDPDHEVAWNHVNGAGDGNVYRLGWSRYYDRSAGERVLEGIRRSGCGGQGGRGAASLAQSLDAAGETH
ncbi:hypothetical protein [Albidovulum sp.]